MKQRIPPAFDDVLIKPMSALHQRRTLLAEGSARSSDEGSDPEALTALAVRVHGEYREMPGLRLTTLQAARLFSVAPEVADAVLHELRRASILVRSRDGAFFIDR